MKTCSVLSLSLCALVCSICAQASGTQSRSEVARDIVRSLRDNVDMDEPPSTLGDQPVEVKVGVSLVDVLSADKSTNQLEFVAWTAFSWKDRRLQWSQNSGFNISNLRFPSKRCWTPDVVVYSQTASADMVYSETDIVVDPSGGVVYVPSKRFRVWCDLANVDTADGAECKMKLGSWAHSSADLDVNFSGEAKMDLSSYFEGSKFEVVGNTAARTVKKYACCPELYVSLDYTLTIRTRSQAGWSAFG